MKSLKGSFHETSDGERQVVTSAQERAAVLRSEMSQETTACHSWKKRSNKMYKRGGGAENEETSRRKLFAFVICPCTTTRNGLFATFFTPLARVDSPSQTSRPAEDNPWEHIVNSTPTNTARTELHIMITFHHANTRGTRAGRLRIAHLSVPKTIVIHASCLIPCRT